MWAAACNNKVVLRALLQEECNVNAKDRSVTTALCHAEAMGNSECVDILIEYKATVPSKSEDKVSMFAASNNRSGGSAAAAAGDA